MKKLLAIALSATMMMAMAIGASAAGSSDQMTGGSKDITVNAAYQNDVASPADSVCVDISWGSMEFTYTVSGKMEWNADKHDYKDMTNATWSASGNTITVTNHSNVSVTTSFSYAAKAGFESVNGSFDQASIDLPSAVGKSLTDSTLTGTSILTLSGALSSGSQDNSTTPMRAIATITVNIEKKA